MSDRDDGRGTVRPVTQTPSLGSPGLNFKFKLITATEVTVPLRLTAHRRAPVTPAADSESDSTTNGHGYRDAAGRIQVPGAKPLPTDQAEAGTEAISETPAV